MFQQLLIHLLGCEFNFQIVKLLYCGFLIISECLFGYFFHLRIWHTVSELVASRRGAAMANGRCVIDRRGQSAPGSRARHTSPFARSPSARPLARVPTTSHRCRLRHTAAPPPPPTHIQVTYSYTTLHSLSL